VLLALTLGRHLHFRQRRLARRECRSMTVDLVMLPAVCPSGGLAVLARADPTSIVPCSMPARIRMA
jgi:hypothetical protein